jgi:hypothetical protein
VGKTIGNSWRNSWEKTREKHGEIMENHCFEWEKTREKLRYPLVNIQKNYGKSPCLMGQLTISIHVQ